MVRSASNHGVSRTLDLVGNWPGRGAFSISQAPKVLLSHAGVEMSRSWSGGQARLS